MKHFMIDKEIQYSFKEKNETLYLFHSKYGPWVDSIKGKVAAKLLNTGNNYVIDFSDGKTVELDYSQSVELMILLNEAEKDVKINSLNLVKEKK